MKPGIVVAAGLCLALANLQAASFVLYSTGFEAGEGFTQDQTLAGQNGWVSEGNGGNGIVSNFFENMGQQAFIGFAPPQPPVTNIVVWRPVNYQPNPTTGSVVKFTVAMAVIDSTADRTNRDEFRWSIYNSAGRRMFSLNFDNDSLLLSYSLDDGQGFISTGSRFTNSALYDLELSMNFEQNLWSASLNDTVVVNSKALTTTGALLDFGDADAVWVINQIATPGNNYMLFDDYRVTAETLTSIPPRFEVLSRPVNGQFPLRLFGESGKNYVIEASADLNAWTPIRTNSAPDGVIDFVDSQAGNFPRRFYRARAL